MKNRAQTIILKKERLTTGCILTGQTPDERRKEYEADITYGTNNEFGFDYLRDNMAWQTSDCVQRGHNFVIVGEVDSILIDEARAPLIISGPEAGRAVEPVNPAAVPRRSPCAADAARRGRLPAASERRGRPGRRFPHAPGSPTGRRAGRRRRRGRWRPTGPDPSTPCVPHRPASRGSCRCGPRRGRVRGS